MTRSMTGYGKSDIAVPQLKISFELRSVNSKYLDLIVNMPSELSYMEMDLRNEVSSEISRGRVEVKVKLLDRRDRGLRVNPDISLAEEYREAIEDMGRVINRPDVPSALDIIGLPGVLRLDEISYEDDEELVQIFNEALSQALENLNAMREREGTNLFEKIKVYLAELDYLKTKIEEIAEFEPERAFNKLEQRIKKILGNDIDSFDEARLLQELAIVADKRDISEELARLDSHIEAFYLFEDKSGANGKEMDFIAQEMMREVNTMASKTSDTELIRLIIQAKTTVEKIREQVQNIE